MGQALTTVFGPGPQSLPVAEQRPSPARSIWVPLPPEASTHAHNWYADFFEKAYCIPHRDGQNMIILEPMDDDEYRDPRARPLWPIKRLKKAYQLLEGADHPRIVRYVESQSPGHT